MTTPALISLVRNALTCKRVVGAFLSLALTIIASACVSVPMVPGSERVKITRDPADVANCKAVGNADPNGDLARNQAVGLGGDTVLDTTPRLFGVIGGADPGIGVIYRCALR